MPTVIVSTIGTGGDYSTPQAWEDAAPADLVAADQIWEGRLKNQAFILPAGWGYFLDINGSTSDATRYKRLTTEPGASFKDHAGRFTSALRFNPTLGASITSSANGFAQCMGLDEAYSRMDGIQFNVTGTNGVWLVSPSSNTTVENCLIQSTGGCIGENRGTVKNCLLVNISNNASYYTNGQSRGTGNFLNVTMVTAADHVATTYHIGRVGGYGCTYKNCAFFGGVDVTTSTSAVTFTNCYTDSAQVISGVKKVAFDTTTGSGFFGIKSGDLDFRLRSSSALIGAGTFTGAPATDITGTPRGWSMDVGAWSFTSQVPNPSRLSLPSSRMVRGSDVLFMVPGVETAFGDISRQRQVLTSGSAPAPLSGINGTLGNFTGSELDYSGSIRPRGGCTIAWIQKPIGVAGNVKVCDLLPGGNRRFIIEQSTTTAAKYFKVGLMSSSSPMVSFGSTTGPLVNDLEQVCVLRSLLSLGESTGANWHLFRDDDEKIEGVTVAAWGAGVGADQNGWGSGFTGGLGKFVVWDRALSDNEIRDYIRSVSSSITPAKKTAIYAPRSPWSVARSRILGTSTGAPPTVAFAHRSRKPLGSQPQGVQQANSEVTLAYNAATLADAAGATSALAGSPVSVATAFGRAIRIDSTSKSVAFTNKGSYFTGSFRLSFVFTTNGSVLNGGTYLTLAGSSGSNNKIDIYTITGGTLRADIYSSTGSAISVDTAVGAIVPAKDYVATLSYNRLTNVSQWSLNGVASGSASTTALRDNEAATLTICGAGAGASGNIDLNFVGVESIQDDKPLDNVWARFFAPRSIWVPVSLPGVSP